MYTTLALGKHLRARACLIIEKVVVIIVGLATTATNVATINTGQYILSAELYIPNERQISIHFKDKVNINIQGQIPIQF